MATIFINTQIELDTAPHGDKIHLTDQQRWMSHVRGERPSNTYFLQWNRGQTSPTVPSCKRKQASSPRCDVVARVGHDNKINRPIQREPKRDRIEKETFPDWLDTIRHCLICTVERSPEKDMALSMAPAYNLLDDKWQFLPYLMYLQLMLLHFND